MRRLMTIAALSAAAAFPAAAQIAAAAPSWATQGYGGAGTAVASPIDPSTRDANNNRVVVNGEIQTAGGTSVQSQFAGLNGGASNTASGASATTGNSASAVANLVNVQVNGSWNTVVVNAKQSNTGAITATAGAGSMQQGAAGNVY